MTQGPLGHSPVIDATATVNASSLGSYTEVGARTKLPEVSLGDYSYVVNDSDIAYVAIEKFTSIAASAASAGQEQRADDGATICNLFCAPARQ